MKLNENLFNIGLNAHIKAAEIADNDPVGGYEGKIWQNIYRTKFAELIIKECLGVTLDYKNDDHYNGWIEYRDAIRKHFGIEDE
jgi:hypothetical protein